MRTVTPALQAHLEGTVLTTCTLWKVTRRDGLIFGFTDHDQNVTFGGVVYLAATGHTASSIKTTAQLSVDNLEVQAMLDSSTITEADIQGGLWDFASVLIQVVNYNDLTMGSMIQRQGWLGNIKTGRHNFIAELRGMMQPLQQVVGRVYSPSCDADLGDTRCGIVLSSFTVEGQVTTTGNQRSFTDTSRTEANGYFDGGVVTWSSSGTLTPLGQSPLNWFGITAHSNGNVYASVISGDIYMQTAGTGNFVGLGQANLSWRGMTAHSNGNVYACVDTGDIYMQTAGTGNFVALGQANLSWRGMTAHSNGNVYACVNNSDIYMQTAGTGNFIALGQTSRLWFGVTAHQNGNVYACVNGGDIYVQTGGVGDFIALGHPSLLWRSIAAHPNGNVYATVNSGDIYVQTGGVGDFIALGHPSLLWRSITVAPNGNLYTCVSLGDIYKQKISTSGLNATYQMEVKTFVAGTVVLQQAMPNAIAIGDTYTMSAGCDKLRTTCKTKFNNIVNFRGFPDVPGTDKMLSGL